MNSSTAPGAPLQVVGICGSLREQSYTRFALHIALRGAGEIGALTSLVDLRDYDLIPYDGRRGDWPPDVLRLREQVRQAQGLIIGTPEYHGSLSGVLKNALDLMSFEEFEGKMLGLVGVSGGALGAVNALNTLRTVGRSLHAWVIPQQVSIPEAWKAFDAQGSVLDERFNERLLEVGRQVARFALLHTAEQAREFLRQWEQAPENPGGASGGPGA